MSSTHTRNIIRGYFKAKLTSRGGLPGSGSGAVFAGVRIPNVFVAHFVEFGDSPRGQPTPKAGRTQEAEMADVVDQSRRFGAFECSNFSVSCEFPN